MTQEQITTQSCDKTESNVWFNIEQIGRHIEVTRFLNDMPVTTYCFTLDELRALSQAAHKFKPITKFTTHDIVSRFDNDEEIRTIVRVLFSTDGLSYKYKCFDQNGEMCHIEKEDECFWQLKR